MLLDNYLNTQFVPHRKHNNLYYKDHPFNVAYKTNPLNAELNPICHLLLVLGTHIILHVSRVWANCCLLSVIWSAQTQCVCKMYKFLTSQCVVCIICNYCGLKGQMSDCTVLQYTTCLTRQRAMSIRSLTITLHKPLTHCKHPPMETKTFQMSDFATGHLRHTHKCHLLAMNISNLMWFGMNSSFCHKTDENSILKGYYEVSSGNSLATFWENLSVPFSEDLWRLDRRLSRNVGKELPLLAA